MREKYGHSSTIPFRCFCAVLLMLLYGALNAQRVAAASYNCGTASHCYATIDWNGTTNGALTSISLADAYMNHIVSYVGSEPLQAFVTHELWMVDAQSPGCAPPSNGCWVEGGWKATAGSAEYFWSDQRPAPNNGFFRHKMGDLKEGEQFVDVQIIRWGGGQYVVDLHAQGPGTDSWYEGYSSPNSMLAHQVSVGTEVYGTHDGYSDWVRFSYNQRVDSVGTWHYQGTRGTQYLTGAPPGGTLLGQWYAYPDQPPYNGGSWTTAFEGR